MNEDVTYYDADHNARPNLWAVLTVTIVFLITLLEWERITTFVLWLYFRFMFTLI